MSVPWTASGIPRRAHRQTRRDFRKRWLHYRGINVFEGSLELFSGMIYRFLKTDDTEMLRKLGAGAKGQTNPCFSISV